MPVQIGAKAHGFKEPLELLSDCHRRIEMFLGILEAIAKGIDRAPSEEARRALDSALRYFREAAPKHTADEEQSLFPRLRRVRSASIEDALSKIDELEKEHLWAETLHKEVDDLGRRYLNRGKLSSDEAERFRKHVASLAGTYERHISIEDRDLFPVAQEALPQADKLAMAEEMANRRNVSRARKV
jgi:hemerythrin-like domain-containing protein